MKALNIIKTILIQVLTISIVFFLYACISFIIPINYKPNVFEVSYAESVLFLMCLNILLLVILFHVFTFNTWTGKIKKLFKNKELL